MNTSFFSPSLRLWAYLAALSFASAAHSAEVAGVHLDDRITLADQELILNGAGLRTRFMFKVYVIGLYLPKKAESSAAALGQPGPRCLHIVTLRKLGADEFADALIDALKRNHNAAELSRLDPRISEFRAALLQLKSPAAGSQIRIEWIPGRGTRLVAGNESIGRDIPGEDFFQALLRIWLGDNPVDPDLAKALLGQR